jgi:hypothetical protein
MNPNDAPQHQADEDEQALTKSLSRRSFLQALGVGTIGAVAANIMIPRFVTSAAASTLPDVEQVKAAIAASPLYNEAIAELAQQEFNFNLALLAPYQITDTSDPNTKGVELRTFPLLVGPTVHSAAMVITVHLVSPAIVVSAVYFVTGVARPVNVQNIEGPSIVELREVLLAVNSRRLERTDSHIASGVPAPPTPPSTPYSPSCTSHYYRYGSWYIHSYEQMQCYFYDQNDRCRPRIRMRYHTRRRSAYYCVQGSSCPEQCEYVCEEEDNSFTHEHPCSDWGEMNSCP